MLLVFNLRISSTLAYSANRLVIKMIEVYVESQDSKNAVAHDSENEVPVVSIGQLNSYELLA